MWEFKKALGGNLKRFLRENSNTDFDLQLLIKAFTYEQPRTNIDDLQLIRLTIEEIDQKIAQLEQLCLQTSSIFSSAINVSGETIISNFLLDRKNSYVDLISSWIERLEKQAKTISALSISQKANAEFIVSILNSIRGYDEILYLQISNEIHSRIQKLNSSEVKTQEEQSSVNTELGEIKQLLQSSISNKLNNLKSESSSLERSSSESEEKTKKMLKYGAILLAVGTFAEVIASIIAIVIFLIFIGAGLGGGG